MIKGLGMDLAELARVAELNQNPRFAQKLLTEAEYEKFQSFKLETRRIEFLAGRWAAKEAFTKAYGTGIGSQVGLQDIEVLNNDKGAPVLTSKVWQDTIHITITHTDKTAAAVVILEKD
jgi:holo-[acyl-carrier protein] synthase